MHKEILTDEQVALLPLLKYMRKEYGLVGGTAIALHIGHRESIDFDLFSNKEFRTSALKKKIERVVKISHVIVDKSGELTFLVGDVKVTFYHYPFDIAYTEDFEGIIKMPNLVTLAAMKAYALGRRAKWKDYVDLRFIMKGYHSLQEIVQQAESIFGTQFNSKLFRIQLAYFDDVKYDEKVVFMPGVEVSEKKIKKELVEFSLE
ncbi:MAG: hypothetical protein A3H59_03415 [Candidatus Jacksonbacteria bacterium RIFCSPLOWO2_02_FULL_43_9]|nr:MAG: hypothetical protein UV70_C0001G0046 [Parcubacteria group bacterium GW2011_GWA2_43_13]OGY71600.1 MAG: hypothetical protein A2986_01670 [Candidatus Jacksonbacteria bacterium RIFCSPLOWO2_01_FULL_44_13]OGY73706.1 MAG: hypothetical protein A3H59_03415 [Candidatus Jacksonbacteria bacterium RIFCSPLOWO2_02_FULL_43_9]HAZ16595.1 hypothetical protein [Candidatus Jacksonbacteria bacterium]